MFIMENNNIKNINVKTCGKLYIAGEYSILKSNQSSIIKNINIFMKAVINFKDKYEIYSDMFKYKVSMKYDKNYSLIQDTIRVMNEYLENKGYITKSLSLNITGKMENNGKKYGIGSSGSVVVLVIKAIDKLYKLKLTKDEIFKLSCYVLLKRNDNGSMGDIACISFENMIYYRSFDREKIKKLIMKNKIWEVIKEDWGYLIEEIKCNAQCEFLVGWTGIPSISGNMIDKVKSSLNEYFYENSEKYVELLKKSFYDGNREQIEISIKGLYNLLENLDKNIINSKLKKLIDATDKLNIVAKSSGAGGGDCGIALSFNEKDSEELIKKWKDENISLLYREKL